MTRECGCRESCAPESPRHRVSYVGGTFKNRRPTAASVLLAAGFATLLSASPIAHASQGACIFTSDELAKVIGQPLRAPEAQKPNPYDSVYCTFEAANDRGTKLIVSVRSKETQQYFATLQRLARIMHKDKFHELKDVGRAAYATPGALRAWDGTRSVHVGGLKGILKREITPAEASALLKLGLERMPR